MAKTKKKQKKIAPRPKAPVKAKPKQQKQQQKPSPVTSPTVQQKPAVSSYKPSATLSQNQPHSIGPSLVVGVIVLTLAAFISLFIKHKNVIVRLGTYNIRIFFSTPSPAFYILITLIVLGVLFILYREAFSRKKLSSPAEEIVKKIAEKKTLAEKKIAAKEVIKSSEKKSAKTGMKKQHVYLMLVLISVVMVLSGFILKNMPAVFIGLVLAGLSMFAYTQLKKSGAIGAQKPSMLANMLKKQEDAKAKEGQKLAKVELGKYETYFDVLYKIVDTKGSVKLSVLAQYFGVNKKRIEEWATILEEHNMLAIHYPMFGEPEIAKVAQKPQEEEANGEK